MFGRCTFLSGKDLCSNCPVSGLYSLLSTYNLSRTRLTLCLRFPYWRAGCYNTPALFCFPEEVFVYLILSLGLVEDNASFSYLFSSSKTFKFRHYWSRAGVWRFVLPRRATLSNFKSLTLILQSTFISGFCIMFFFQKVSEKPALCFLLNSDHHLCFYRFHCLSCGPHLLQI